MKKTYIHPELDVLSVSALEEFLTGSTQLGADGNGGADDNFAPGGGDGNDWETV